MVRGRQYTTQVGYGHDQEGILQRGDQEDDENSIAALLDTHIATYYVDLYRLCSKHQKECVAFKS